MELGFSPAVLCKPLQMLRPLLSLGLLLLPSSKVFVEDMTKAPARSGSPVYFLLMPTIPHSLPNKHSALHSRVLTCMWVECWEREIDSGPLAHRNLVLVVRFQLELFSDAQAARPLRSLLNPHLSLDSCFPSPVLLGTGETKGPRSLCRLQLWAQPRAVRGRLDPRGCCTGYQAG